MSEFKPTTDVETQLNEARARREDLRQSLLAINGGDPNLYAAMGRNEGYDSLLCLLRSEEFVIAELNRVREAVSREQKP